MFHSYHHRLPLLHDAKYFKIINVYSTKANVIVNC